jgi:hypothetical protein
LRLIIKVTKVSRKSRLFKNVTTHTHTQYICEREEELDLVSKSVS